MNNAHDENSHVLDKHRLPLTDKKIRREEKKLLKKIQKKEKKKELRLQKEVAIDEEHNE